MLAKLSSFACPKIERLLKKLEVDENSYNEELRSLDRVKLVIPVELSTHDRDFEVLSFSRNVSSGGVCLITPQPFTSGMEMNVELSLPQSLSKHTAECRWNQKFGQAYWTSGWKFTTNDLDVAATKEADTMVELDRRSAKREQYAIPVIVHQKAQQSRLHAFTRNVSVGGTELVANHEVPENTFCMLEFVHSDGERCDIIAECIRSRKYGKKHWIMGWRFPEQEEIANLHAECFDR